LFCGVHEAKMHKVFLTAFRDEPVLKSQQAMWRIDSEMICRSKKVYDKRRRMIVRRMTFTVVCGAALATTIGAQVGRRHTSLRIGLITAASAISPAAASGARGVRLGAAESKQTAALFGDDVELYETDGGGTTVLNAAEQLLSARKVQVLIGVSAADADALSRLAESRRVIFVNAASRSQALRAACRRYTFHVEATDAMYANAATAARQIPVTVSANASVPSDRAVRDSVTLWGPSLQRFGASQLNDRYRDRYHIDMDGFAWAGWAAVKIAAEAALRTRATSPANLVAYLESPGTQFDGHKGWSLTFRLADHQLRQPLYIAKLTGAGGYRYTDVPELRDDSSLGARNNSGSRARYQVLDSLMASPGAQECRWSRK
jgi:ABC-type branched-subunit amino acid transport system substrate-binding protein